MTDALSRYQARREQLTRGAVPTGDSLEAIGDILRRAERLGRDGVEQALRRLSRSDIDTWLRTRKPETLQPALLRAAEEAAEAGLGDEGEEAEVWRTSSLEGLTARDRAESAARAITEWEALHGPLDGDTAQRWKAFRQGLGRLDTALRPKARWFIPLNVRRREERDVLDTAERARAWWFTDRADCDDFLAVLGNPPEKPGPHLQTCPDCRSDLASTSLVEKPPKRLPDHLGEEELWRFDMGMMSAVELAWVDRHTQNCLDCAQAIWALEEGDDAITQALEEQELPEPAARSSRSAEPVRKPGAARHPEQREVLEERREFRVVLVRERQRARLVVQPLSGRAVTAAVFLAPGKPSLKPQQGPEGLEFDLGTGGAGRSAHLMVRVGSSEIFERDFSF